MVWFNGMNLYQGKIPEIPLQLQDFLRGMICNFKLHIIHKFVSPVPIILNCINDEIENVRCWLLCFHYYSVGPAWNTPGLEEAIKDQVKKRERLLSIKAFMDNFSFWFWRFRKGWIIQDMVWQRKTGVLIYYWFFIAINYCHCWPKKLQSARFSAVISVSLQNLSYR